MAKKRLKRSLLLLLLTTLVVISVSYILPKSNITTNAVTKSPATNNITIANWNLQIFGQSKADNEELMNKYKEIIKKYDIIFVQEIRDSSETAFPKLCNLLEHYKCKTSSRAGRSSSKEQYGIIYKDNIEISNFIDYNPDNKDRWERPPIKVTFTIKNYELTAYNIHTKPEDVKNELNYLQNIVEDKGNVVILGDLNADCNYYNNILETQFDSWNWIINDSEDTTVSNTNCAYDRIIMNQDSYKEYLTYGIYKENINSDVSDHYLVYF